MAIAGGLRARDAERGVLASSLARARSGSGRFVIVAGPDGIGKSRLLAEARALAMPDFQVALARAGPLQRDVPFAVARQLFAALAGRPGTMDRQDRQERQDWHEQPGDVRDQAARALDAAVAPEAADGGPCVSHSLFRLVCELCGDRPLALLIDDLHEADLASLKFLTHLVQRIEQLPCCVVVAVRTEPAHPPALLADGPLKTIMFHPAGQVLYPPPLGPEAIESIMQEEFARSATPRQTAAAWAHAYREACGGNPLLAKDLARALAAQQPAPDTAAGARRTGAHSSRTLTDRMLAAVRRLPAPCGSLAESVAVLGGSCPSAVAAHLAGLAPGAARSAVRDLEDAGVLERRGQGEGEHLGFVHPLLHTALYDALPADQRSAGHRRAAQLLHAEGRPVEEAAVHLLRTPPGADAEAARLLLRAGQAAQARGSPEAALVYLRRCLEEPAAQQQMPVLLCALGRAARLADPAVTVETLAPERQPGGVQPHRHAQIALPLGRALLLSARSEEALRVWTGALGETPDDETELLHHLRACVFSIPFYEPGRPEMRHDILRQVAHARHQRRHPTLGGKALDCVIAGHEAVLGDPRAVLRALQATHGSVSGDLAQETGGDVALPLAWLVLISADREEALDSIARALDRIRRTGSLHSLAQALTYRAMARLARGELAEAEADAQQAVHAAEASSPTPLRFVLGPLWADILMAQGRLPAAERALAWAHCTNPATLALKSSLPCSRSRLLRLHGQCEQALQEALAAGSAFEAAGGANPALVPWRTEAALCLHALGRDEEALSMAYENLRQARNWSAPRAWGTALGVLGLLQDPAAGGLDRLAEAVNRLRSSPARLAYATALADYGAALRTAGRGQEAARAEQEALGIATRCAATPLVERLAAQPLRNASGPGRACSKTCGLG
ncbi:ATP-binding protein [Streptomyces sp. NPDC101151]|uniref:ATP-binding protein n=1 Tax=Streptomyces sp. NPDC101151 TaxID=3366115 RepID=UPI003825EFAA